jgi:hypothetical protein
MPLNQSSFIQEIFNEDSGKTSMGRIGSFLSLVVVSVGILYVAFKTHVFQIPSGSTEFISAPYAINKVTNVVNQIAGKNNQANNQVQA